MRRLTFVLLCLLGALLSFNVAATAALIPSVAGSFSVPPFAAGGIVWGYMFAYGVCALAYGPLARVVSIRRILLVGVAFFSLANLAAACAHSLPVLLGARLLMGICGASIIPLSLIVIGTHAPLDQRGRLVGSFFGFTFIASLFGLFLSGIIHWRLIYLIPALSGGILWFVLFRYLPPLRCEGSGPTVNYRRAFLTRKVQVLLGYIVCVSFLYHGVQGWLSVYYATRHGFSQPLISVLITLTSLSGIFGEFAGGVSSDRWGRRKTVNLGLVCMIAGVFLLLGQFHAAVYALIMFVWGIGWTLNHAGLSAALTDLPGELLHEAASLNSGVRFIAGGLGTACAGLLMQKSFIFGFACLGAAFVFLLIASNSFRAAAQYITEDTKHGH